MPQMSYQNQNRPAPTSATHNHEAIFYSINHSNITRDLTSNQARRGILPRGRLVAKAIIILGVLVLVVFKVDVAEVAMVGKEHKDKLMQLLELRLVAKMLLWMV